VVRPEKSGWEVVVVAGVHCRVPKHIEGGNSPREGGSRGGGSGGGVVAEEERVD